MKNNFFKELSVAVILISVSIALLNPLHLWMPDMVHMIMLAGLFIIFSIFAIFVIREKGGDERDEAHRMRSGRTAFLLGALVLVLAIGYQTIRDIPIDPWLIIALIAMVIGKIASRFYSDRAL